MPWIFLHTLPQFARLSIAIVAAACSELRTRPFALVSVSIGGEKWPGRDGPAVAPPCLYRFLRHPMPLRRSFPTSSLDHILVKRLTNSQARCASIGRFDCGAALPAKRTWAAWLDENGKKHRKRFPVSTRGGRRTQALAMAARGAAMAELREDLTCRDAICE